MRLERLAPIALVACALLIYEVAVTRVLSVVLWYHFAFLSVSLAMLGVGAPGVWFALRQPSERALRLALLAASALLPLSVIAILRLRLVVDGLDLSGSWYLLVVVIAGMLPMLALGSAICILLMRAANRQVGVMYGADLLGGMLGALLTPLFLDIVPTPQLIALLALLPLTALVIYSRSVPRSALIIAALVVATLGWEKPFEVVYNKSYSEQRQRPILARWTQTARITLFDHPIWSTNQNTPWLWGVGERYDPKPVRQMWIDQDGSAGMPIEHFTGDLKALDHLLFDVTSVGYQWAEPGRVCVIGAGGGKDLLTALAAGATEIDAVELNPAIVEIVSSTVREFSGDVYHHRGVRPVISEGRSYLTRAFGNYDLVQISLVDSWAATSAGAYALSENFLYTVEALQLYWSRLSDRGVVSISRWSKGLEEFECARLAHLAQEALSRLKVDHPKQHLAFIEGDGVGTLLMSRRAFIPEQLERLDAVCAARGFRRLWPVPLGAPTTLVASVFYDGIDRFTRLGLDLSPPTDDRPFFFQTLPLLNLQADPSQLNNNGRSVTLLREVLIWLGMLAIVMFFAPFLLGRGARREPGLLRGSAYFAAIGLGFMCIEMPWIQRSILLLGHPTFATSVVLGVLLLGAGLGSIVAGRLELRIIQRWRFVLPFLVAGTFLACTYLFPATLGLSFGWRLGVAMLLLLPTGFVMGFAFPSGMMRFGDENKAWFWAINGAFSVFAGALSLALAMIFGFWGVVAVGIVAYFAAAMLVCGQASGVGGENREYES